MNIIKGFYGKFIVANRCWDWTYIIGNLWFFFSKKVFLGWGSISPSPGLSRRTYRGYNIIIFIFIYFFAFKRNIQSIHVGADVIRTGHWRAEWTKRTLASYYYYYYIVASAKWMRWWKVSLSRPRLGLHSRWFGVGLLITRGITGNLFAPSMYINPAALYIYRLSMHPLSNSHHSWLGVHLLLLPLLSASKGHWECWFPLSHCFH